MKALAIALCVLVLLSVVAGFSLKVDKVEELISKKCFGRDYSSGGFIGREYLLGQINPVGNSIENLIALIEKIESKMPQLTALQTTIMILKRFRIDGLRTRTGGAHEPFDIHKFNQKITDQILNPSRQDFVQEFPEDLLTDDEKCSLFNMLSHRVNRTARYDDNPDHVYEHTVPGGGRSQAVKPKNLNVSAPAQSGFLTRPTNVKAAAPMKETPPPTPAPTKPVKIDKDDPFAGIMMDQAAPSGTDKLSYNNAVITEDEKLRATRMPREEGVVGFRNNRWEAIAAGRVLLGIAAGLLNPTTQDVKKIVLEIDRDANADKLANSDVDPLLAVTLADLLGMDTNIAAAGIAGPQKFGAEGEWNSTACQTTYRLRTGNGTYATIAQLKGGIDGYNIGKKLLQLKDKMVGIPLSAILRFYYNPRGFSPFGHEASVCQRAWSVNDELRTKIDVEGKAYLRIWNGIRHSSYYDEVALLNYIGKVLAEFRQALTKSGDPLREDPEFCLNSAATNNEMKLAPCETPSDIFFMLDINEPKYSELLGKERLSSGYYKIGKFEEQIELITHVARNLDLRRQGGTITVLINSQYGGSIILNETSGDPMQIPLAALAYNTTNSQCATCRAAFFNFHNANPLNDRVILLELINKTLMEYERDRIQDLAVPAKSFVWFDYAHLSLAPTDRDTRRRYDDAKLRLRYEQRDIPLIFAGVNKESVKDLIRADEDFFAVGEQSVDSLRMTGDKLARRLCQTPATFQHFECKTQTSKDKVYEGYITPGFKQHWAIYPEYFLKSFSIEVKFKSDAKIKVCFDRYPNPDRDEYKYCKEPQQDGTEVVWRIRNPCKDKTYANCLPFYFTILARQETPFTTGCNDVRCKTLDQVRFTFTHTGLACSFAINILSSTLLVFIMFFVLRHLV